MFISNKFFPSRKIKKAKKSNQIKFSFLILIGFACLLIGFYLKEYVLTDDAKQHLSEQPNFKTEKVHLDNKNTSRTRASSVIDNKATEIDGNVTNVGTDTGDSISSAHQRQQTEVIYNEIDTLLKGNHFNGSALVVKDNQVVMNNGYGDADFKNKIPNTPNTVFFLGSITKVFVATAIMQLQEQNKLNVQDPVSKYIPDFPHGNEIKLLTLISHSSGLPKLYKTVGIHTHKDLIRTIGQQKLNFKPGTRWEYCDSNYSVLAYIVELITHQSFEDYVQNHIFSIAKMKTVGFGKSFYNQSSFANGYSISNSKTFLQEINGFPLLFGCGDIYTTPYDLYLFDRALYTGKLISQDSLKQFLTPNLATYCFGLYVKKDYYDNHGVLSGWLGVNTIGKKEGNYIVLLSNIHDDLNSLIDLSKQIGETIHISEK